MIYSDFQGKKLSALGMPADDPHTGGIEEICKEDGESRRKSLTVMQDNTYMEWLYGLKNIADRQKIWHR